MREEDITGSPNLVAGTLILAITVILAAIITIYVFPISGSTSPSGPNTVFTIDDEITNVNGENEIKITFGYNVGDSIDANELKVTVNSNQAYSLDTENVNENDIQITKAPDLTTQFSGSASFNIIGYADPTQSNTNSTITPDEMKYLQSGDVIRVIWTDNESNTEQVLREYTIPNNIAN